VPSAGRTDHVVAFYKDNELAELAGEFLLSAVRNGGVAVVVATPDHRLWLNSWLSRAGVDLAAAQANGSYVVFDARETISRYLINGQPDPAAFWQAISPVLASATRRRAPVRVFGEMVALLWDDGLLNAAIEVEALWNEMAAHFPFELLCAYPAASVSGPEHSDALAQVCGAHSKTIGAPPLWGDGRVASAGRVWRVL
jgi:MEDS: MEthanogen/methylotroph, DcmR Sensory domain